jgi:TRAP-type C4-dicarboxylate transport system substrate-binding protein
MTTISMSSPLRLLAMLLAATTFAGTAQAVDLVKLKLSSFEPPMANITSNVLTPFAKDAAAASGGALQIDVFAGGTLGRNPTQQLKLVTDGIADIAWIVLPYTPGRFDDTEVVGLPFVSQTATEASVALHRLYASGALVGFEGLKMLAVAATPPVVIHSIQPVRLPTDLKSKRVRASGQQLTNIIEAVGGAPVTVGGGQIAESLSRGVVDMTLNNWGFVGDFKVNEVSSHHLDVPLGAVAVGIVMRQDRYDALPPQARAAIDKSSGEMLARKLGVAFDRQEKEVRERVSGSGRNTVIQPTAAQLAEWKRVIEPINDAWRGAKPRNQRTYEAFVKELGRVRSSQ